MYIHTHHTNYIHIYIYIYSYTLYVYIYIYIYTYVCCTSQGQDLSPQSAELCVAPRSRASALHIMCNVM